MDKQILVDNDLMRDLDLIWRRSFELRNKTLKGKVLEFREKGVPDEHTSPFQVFATHPTRNAIAEIVINLMEIVHWEKYIDKPIVYVPEKEPQHEGRK